MNFIKKAKKTSVRAHGEIVARLIVDTNRNKILFVPAEINHPEFLALELGISLDQLKQQPDMVSPFIGVAVRIINGLAVDVLVGISGLETYFGRFKSPLHTKKQVNEARNLILATLQAGKILSEDFKLRMLYK